MQDNNIADTTPASNFSYDPGDLVDALQAQRNQANNESAQLTAVVVTLQRDLEERDAEIKKLQAAIDQLRSANGEGVTDGE